MGREIVDGVIVADVDEVRERGGVLEKCGLEEFDTVCARDVVWVFSMPG